MSDPNAPPPRPDGHAHGSVDAIAADWQARRGGQASGLRGGPQTFQPPPDAPAEPSASQQPSAPATAPLSDQGRLLLEDFAKAGVQVTGPTLTAVLERQGEIAPGALKDLIAHVSTAAGSDDPTAVRLTIDAALAGKFSQFRTSPPTPAGPPPHPADELATNPQAASLVDAMKRKAAGFGQGGFGLRGQKGGAR